VQESLTSNHRDLSSNTAKKKNFLVAQVPVILATWQAGTGRIMFRARLGKQFSRFPSLARCRWLTPITLATQEAEIREIAVQSQARQIVNEPLEWLEV
jgi:hypothetical protein